MKITMFCTLAVESPVAVLTLWWGSRAGSSKGFRKTGSRCPTWPGWANVGDLTSSIALTLVSAVPVTLAA